MDDLINHVIRTYLNCLDGVVGGFSKLVEEKILYYEIY